MMKCKLIKILKNKIEDIWYYDIKRRYYKLRLFWRTAKIYYHGPYVMCDQLFHLPFVMFCEYYEECDIKNRTLYVEEDVNPMFPEEWELLQQQNKMYEEYHRLYHWYKIERPQRKEELEYLLELWSEHEVSWVSGYKLKRAPNNKYAEYIFKMMRELEDQFEKEKQENLMTLIKYSYNMLD